VKKLPKGGKIMKDYMSAAAFLSFIVGMAKFYFSVM